MAGLGALLIVAGTAASALSTSGSGGPVETFWYSSVLFGAAQVFFSGEKVFEESTFGAYTGVNVMVMFCWTIWTQFTLGWALYPIQGFKEFGDLNISGIPQVV